MDNKKRRSSLRKSVALDLGATDNRPQLKRRISFSGRHLVREFHEEEEPKTWNNSYEISDHLNVDETASNLNRSRKPKQITGAVKNSHENKENVGESRNYHKMEKLDSNQFKGTEKSVPLKRDSSLLSTTKDLINVSYQNSKLYQIENTLDITLCDREMKFRVVEGNKENEGVTNTNIYSFSIEDNEKQCQSLVSGEGTNHFISELKSASTSLGEDNITVDDGAKSLGKNEVIEDGDLTCTTVENAPEVLTIYMNDSLEMSCINECSVERPNVFNESIENSPRTDFENNKEMLKPLENIKSRQTIYLDQPIVEDLNKENQKETISKTKARPTSNFSQPMELSPENTAKHGNNVRIQNLKSRQTNVFNQSIEKSKELLKPLENIKLRKTIYLDQPIVEDLNTENQRETISKTKARPTSNFNQPMEMSPENTIKRDVRVQNLKSRQTNVFNESIENSTCTEFENNKEILKPLENIKLRQTIYLDQPIVEDLNTENQRETISKTKARLTSNFSQPMEMSPENTIKHGNNVHIQNLKSRQTSAFNESIENSPHTQFEKSKEMLKPLENIKLRQTTYLSQPIEEDLNKENQKGAIPKIKARATVNFNQPIDLSPENIIKHDNDVPIQNLKSRQTNVLNESIENSTCTEFENNKEILKPLENIKLRQTTYLSQPIEEDLKKENQMEAISKIKEHPTSNFNQPMDLSAENLMKLRETTYLNQPIVDLNKENQKGAIPKIKARSTINFNQPIEISPVKNKVEFTRKTIICNKEKSEVNENASKIPYTSPIKPHTKQRRTSVFEDEDNCNDSIKKNEQNKIEDYFDFDVTQYRNGNEKNNTIFRCSQDDDLKLDNTSFLAKAKLSDETLSRNSSKKELLNDSMDVFNESLKEDEMQFVSSAMGSNIIYTKNKSRKEDNNAVCSLFRNAHPILKQTIENIKNSSNLTESKESSETKKTNQLECSFNASKYEYRQTMYLNDDIDSSDIDNQNIINEDRLQQKKIPIQCTATANETFYSEDMEIDESEKHEESRQEKREKRETIYPNNNIDELTENVCDVTDSEKYLSETRMVKGENEERRRTIYPNSDIKNDLVNQEDNSVWKNFENRNINPCNDVDKANIRKNEADNLSLKAGHSATNENANHSIKDLDAENSSEPLERYSKPPKRTMYFNNHTVNNENMVLATPVKTGTSNHFFYLTPRLSLIEFTNIERRLNSGIMSKRLPANLTPLESIQKRRQTLIFSDSSMEETDKSISIDNIIEEKKDIKAPLSLSKSKASDKEMASSAICSNESILQTPKSQRQSRIPIPISKEKISDESESQISTGDNSLKETKQDFEEDNFAESIQLVRRATTFLNTSDVPIEHTKEVKAKKSIFGDNPITISDVSQFFEAQRKSQIVASQEDVNLDNKVINVSGITAIETDKKVLENRYIHLTLEDIDKTHLSLVQASYEYESDNESINECQDDGEESKQTNTNIPENSSQCADNSKHIESQTNNINNLQKKASDICRKCNRCQDTILNETTSSLSSFVKPNLPPLPDIGLDKLRRLRQRPTIADVNVLWQSVGLDRTMVNTINISDDSYVASDIKDNIEEVIRKHENDIQDIEKNLLEQQPPAKFVKQLSFVARLNDLLNTNSSNWIFDFQKQYRGILIFSHRKMYTFSLLLTYDEIDPFGYDIKLKSIKLEKGNIPEKCWKPIDYVLDFQFKLNLPYDLQSLCETSNEAGIFKMLQAVDSICIETVKMAYSVQRIGFVNQAYIVRDGGRTYLRKIIRKMARDDAVLKQYVEKTQVKIELLNLKKLSFKDICSPPLHNFCEKINLLPVSLQFLKEFLPNPLLYLKTS